ncbi:Trp biosynthesis-associated membrane protein [Nocardioides sp. InS609-2]|uniref:Trp biosynthesis-associated membrane protein n=1 Tax=Nocardioides sp. InS609-2 TaxID=2760705 RepID=UPI0020BDDFBF|nr:Trp biosynthesis-associated membrane protein [Nocardioides sp. InS609-2]
MADSRPTFGPVVLLGLASAGLGAVAGSKELVSADLGSAEPNAAFASTLVIGAGQLPLAGALSLVLLACWGVLLVTRGRVRRGVTWLALLAALGLVTTMITGWFTLADQFRTALGEVTEADIDITWSAWFWVACVGAVLSLVAAAAAVRFVGTWPEMGSKYDAPTDQRRRLADAETDESQDLWKAIDEGRDPTA